MHSWQRTSGRMDKHEGPDRTIAQKRRYLQSPKEDLLVSLPKKLLIKSSKTPMFCCYMWHIVIHLWIPTYFPSKTTACKPQMLAEIFYVWDHKFAWESSVIRGLSHHKNWPGCKETHGAGRCCNPKFQNQEKPTWLLHLSDCQNATRPSQEQRCHSGSNKSVSTHHLLCQMVFRKAKLYS